MTYEEYLFKMGVIDPKGFSEREKNREKMFHEMVEDLTALKEKHRWHYPSKGELPEDGLLVLCYRKTADGYQYKPCQQFNGDVWYDEYMDILETDELPIAWQYLPEPPKEDSV